MAELSHVLTLGNVRYAEGNLEGRQAQVGQKATFTHVHFAARKLAKLRFGLSS
jgi:hypothetical protein